MPRKKTFSKSISNSSLDKKLETIVTQHGFDRPVATSSEIQQSSKEISRRPKRHKTGRDRQLNLKVSEDCKNELTNIADQNGWGLGETLEHLLSHWRQNA